MLKAIVFDFDGVIVDSEPIHYRAFLDVAATFEFTFDYEHYLRHYVGFDDRDGFRHMLVEAGQPVDEQLVADLCNQKQEAFDRIAGEGVPMIQGARELIEEAAAITGAWPIAVASGATSADIDLILGGLSLRDRFAVIVSADHVHRSKPHPQTYELAVERLAGRYPDLAIKPEHCLAIEDTAAGLESAKAAGLRTLALTTTTGPAALAAAERVEENLSNVTIETLDQWYD